MNEENADIDDSLTVDPENITLIPSEERAAKARCTIRTTRIKQEHDTDDEADEVQRAIASADHKNVFLMELPSNSSGQGDSLKLHTMG